MTVNFLLIVRLEESDQAPPLFPTITDKRTGQQASQWKHISPTWLLEAHDLHIYVKLKEEFTQKMKIQSSSTPPTPKAYKNQSLRSSECFVSQWNCSFPLKKNNNN